MLSQLAWFVVGAAVGSVAESKTRKFIVENNLEQKLKDVEKPREEFTQELIKVWKQKKAIHGFGLNTFLRDLGLSGRKQTLDEVLKNVKDAIRDADGEFMKEQRRKKAEAIFKGGSSEHRGDHCRGHSGDDCCS